MVDTRRSRGRPSASKPPKACRSLTDAMHKASAKAGIEYPPSIPINNTNHYCVGNDVSVQDSQASFAAIDTPAALPSLSESQPIGTRDEDRHRFAVGDLEEEYECFSHDLDSVQLPRLSTAIGNIACTPETKSPSLQDIRPSLKDNRSKRKNDGDSLRNNRLIASENQVLHPGRYILGFLREDLVNKQVEAFRTGSGGVPSNHIAIRQCMNNWYKASKVY